MSAESETARQGAVMVTGGGNGIGRAIALRFAQAGEPVLIFDRDAGAGEQVVAELAGRGLSAVACAGSVHSEADVDAAFALAETRYGGVRVLVNNAGISCNRPTVELELGDWQRTLDVNLTGVFLCAREAARRLQAQGREGVIVNMASMYGVVAAPNRVGYCATKAAVVMMTKALAVEWAAAGIRVNAVAPGYVQTALTQELMDSGRLDAAAIRRRTPQGRFGTPEEVADVVHFLASEQARYVTGQTLGIDGGWSAYGYL